MSAVFAGNSALGPADLPDGIFEFLDSQEFSESGVDPSLDLVVGQKTGPSMLSFDTASPGSFSDTIVLHGTGHNASGVSGSIDDITLIVEGTVITQGPTVHGPSGFVLLLAAMLVSVAMQTQRRIRSK